jgi:hypothetical protein
MKPPSFWKRVIWSDETKVNLFGSDGKSQVWRRCGEAYENKTTKKTVKHGNGRIIFWGCVSHSGLGNLVILEENLTGARYVKLLQENLLASAEKMSLGSDFVFQQDNDPKHRSRLAKNFFEENKIKVME